MTDYAFASIVYYSEPLPLGSKNFAAPAIPGGGDGSQWEMLGLPGIVARSTSSAYTKADSNGKTRLWYQQLIALTGAGATFQANFPTDKARKGALANFLTRWLESATGLTWTAEDPVYFDDPATILGVNLVRRWIASSGVGGNPVTLWVDTIGGVTLAEAAPGNEPSLLANVAALNNAAAISAADAVRDLTSGVLAPQAQPYETFVMGVIDPLATGVIYSGSLPGVGELSVALGGQTSFTTDGGTILSDAVPPSGENVLYDTLANGLQSRLQVDDHAAITGAAGAGAPKGFIAFNDSTQATGAFPLSIAEILATDIVVSDSQRAALQGYMTGTYRWNLSNP